MEPFLRVCDISYAYHSPLGATPALSGISFTVNKGEFLAIVGPSRLRQVNPAFPSRRPFDSGRRFCLYR